MNRLRAIIRRQFGSLTIYNYRLYFCGQLISLVGTWTQSTGQAWLVLRLTGSPLALGTVITLQFLPITLFTLFGGVFADRLPRRPLLMVTNTAAMLQALVLGLLVVTGNVELWHVYVMAFCLGTVNALDGPVRQSFAMELVGREQLVNAVALNSTVFNLARVLGPAIGGVAIALVGMSATFFINAGSFVAVLLAYMAMHPADFRGAQNRVRATGNVFAQIGEGFAYALRTPPVLFLFIILLPIGMFGFNFMVIIPLVAEFLLEAGPERFGLLTSFLGAGALIAALSIAAAGRASERVHLAAASGFVVLLAALALSRSYELTAGILVLFGVCSLTFSTTVNTGLQLAVPDELRGRIMSIFFLFMAGTTPVGGYLTGFIAEHAGVAEALLIEAAVCAAGIAAALVYRARRLERYRRQQEPAADEAQPARAAAATAIRR